MLAGLQQDQPSEFASRVGLAFGEKEEEEVAGPVEEHKLLRRTGLADQQAVESTRSVSFKHSI